MRVHEGSSSYSSTKMFPFLRELEQKTLAGQTMHAEGTRVRPEKGRFKEKGQQEVNDYYGKVAGERV